MSFCLPPFTRVKVISIKTFARLWIALCDLSNAITNI